MCFSAQASFITAGGLTILGLISLKIAKKYSEKPIALIPFFFGIQQAVEGILWLMLPSHSLLATLPAYVYIIFAYMFWPIWMPFALSRYEKEFWRKVIMYASMGLGICFALFALKLIVFNGVHASIEQHHIVYSVSKQPSLYNTVLFSLVYFMAAVVPMVISSRKYVWLLGACTCISYVVAFVFYHAFLASIWCFYAAIISGLTLYVIYANQQKKVGN